MALVVEVPQPSGPEQPEPGTPDVPEPDQNGPETPEEPLKPEPLIPAEDRVGFDPGLRRIDVAAP